MNTPLKESGKNTRTSLAKGNEAFRQSNFAQAIAYYAQVIIRQPELAKSISANLSVARKKYRNSRQESKKPSVAICGWELAHNAAGRAYTLATIYQTFAQVEMIGTLFPGFGREIWEPIRETAINKHTFVVEDESKFIEQAIQLVVAHPYDIVHLSKPRAPNIFFGIIYKLLWGAKILVDIDDEELSYVGAETPISIKSYIQQHKKLPELKDLAGKEWTRLAVGLVKEFDGVTVCNAALQERYGGEIIRHARDEKMFKPSAELKKQCREKYGIPQDAKVVLFFGTPREHKGLIETAQAIATVNRPEIIYCIVGSFPDESLKQRLLEVKGCSYKFIPNQPISNTPEVLAIADCCVLLQDTNSAAAQFQTPAKLSDALGMEVPVISYPSFGLQEIAQANVLLMTNKESLKSDLEKILIENSFFNGVSKGIKSTFKEMLSIGKNAEQLRKFILDSKFTTTKSFLKKECVDTILSQFIYSIPRRNLSNVDKLYQKGFYVNSPAKTLNNVLPNKIKSDKHNLKLYAPEVNINVFGNTLSEDIIKPIREINLPYFSVLVYAENMSAQLRLTLEALAIATAGLNCSITVICDWNCESKISNDFIEGRNVEIKFNNKKIGFYANVSEFLSASQVKNILIMRAGVVITSDGVQSLVKKVISDDIFDVAGILSNNTPFTNLQIKSGSNLLLTNILVKNLFSKGGYERLVMPSFECFMVTRNALKLVPFPSWSLEQDSSAQSLIRWYQELSLRGGRSGIILDCYAHVLSERIVSDYEIIKYLDPRSSQELILILNTDKKLAEDINVRYDSTNAVIQPGGTICFILQSLKLGGGGLVIANLANHLILLGYDVRVYQKSHYEPSHKKGFNLLFEPRRYFELEYALKETPVYTTYIATLWSTARDVETLKERKFGAKGLYYIQDYEPLFYENYSKDKDQISYRLGSVDSYSASLEWVYTSNWIKNQLAYYGHKSNFRSHKINVGIDHAIFNPILAMEMREHYDHKVVIGAMARPSTPRRGFELLVRSLRIVKQGLLDVEIVFFGEVDYECHNIDFQFINKGIVEPQELSELYKTFDIFVDTSDFQGFGLCALEAMCSGCSCVITNSGGVLEYAENNHNALIVPHTEAKVAEAITLLVNNVDLRKKLAHAGIDTAKKFDIYNNAKSWSKLLGYHQKSISKNPNGCAVVVPVFNNINVVKRCLNSAFCSIRGKDILVVVDDASDSHTKNELLDFASNHDGVILVRNEINLGFVGSSNRGMSIARDLDKDIILLNSDTIVPLKWVERMELAAYSQETPSIVSPLATASSHLQLDINPGDSFVVADAWLQENVHPRYPEIITPEGWCFYVPRAVYHTIGFIDPAYGRGYCEESDLCMRAYTAGFELRCCDNLLIYHQGKVSFGDERSSLYENNRKIFDNRWLNIYNRIYQRFIKKDPLASIRISYLKRKAYSPTNKIKEFDRLTDVLNHPLLNRAIDQIRGYDYFSAKKNKNVSSVAFLVPEFLPYGGVLSVVSLVNELVVKNIDAKIVVLKSKGCVCDNLKSLVQPIFIENYSDIKSQFPEVELIVATGWITIYYAALVAAEKPWLHLAYYIQDFEPDFPDVKSNLKLHKAALETYRLGLPSFCKTNWIREKVSKSGGNEVGVVLPALDVDVFYRRDVLGSEECDVLAMYRPDTMQRDPSTLLEVVKRIRFFKPEVRIWFFGDEVESIKLVKNGLIDRACGIVNNDKLPLLYSQSKIFLETSLFHGFGRTITEAMACETACVITDSGGPADFVKHNFNALVSQPKDVNGIAANALALLEDEEMRIGIARNGRNSILTFNPSQSASSIAKYLNISLL